MEEEKMKKKFLLLISLTIIIVLIIIFMKQSNKVKFTPINPDGFFQNEETYISPIFERKTN